MAACIVSFAPALEAAKSSEAVRADATKLQQRFGKNIYSDFLMKFGCRPSVPQAAAIGRLIGARVLADDDSLQPELTEPQREQRRRATAERRRELKLELAASRLVAALDQLARCQADPKRLAHHLASETNAPELLERCESAIEWMVRFAKEWRSHGEKDPPD
jgi:hypothetical protein